MAILIGVLAPQYMKYVEKSRTSADKDTMDSLYNALTIAAADPDTQKNAPSAAGAVTAGTYASGDSEDFWTAVYDTLGVTNTGDYTKKFKSKTVKGKMPTISMDAQGNFSLTVTEGSNTITIPEKKS